MKTDALAVIEERQWAGLAAYRVLAGRISLLWPAVPIFYLLQLFSPTLVHGIHPRTANTGAHAEAGGELVQIGLEGRRAQLFGIAGVGTTLVLLSSFCGANKVISWLAFRLLSHFLGACSGETRDAGNVLEHGSWRSRPGGD